VAAGAGAVGGQVLRVLQAVASLARPIVLGAERPGADEPAAAAAAAAAAAGAPRAGEDVSQAHFRRRAQAYMREAAGDARGADVGAGAERAGGAGAGGAGRQLSVRAARGARGLRFGVDAASPACLHGRRPQSPAAIVPAEPSPVLALDARLQIACAVWGGHGCKGLARRRSCCSSGATGHMLQCRATCCEPCRQAAWQAPTHLARGAARATQRLLGPPL